MAVIEKICEYAQRLPESLQVEVLDFVEFLLGKTRWEAVSQDENVWAESSPPLPTPPACLLQTAPSPPPSAFKHRQGRIAAGYVRRMLKSGATAILGHTSAGFIGAIMMGLVSS
ncbi:MAG: DUF2281 domain-containing protein [Bacillota bacterium]